MDKDYAELIARAYDDGFLAGKNDTAKQYAEFRNACISHLENLIMRAVVKGEFESVAYARQLLRSLNK